MSGIGAHDVKFTNTQLKTYILVRCGDKQREMDLRVPGHPDVEIHRDPVTKK